MVVAPEDIVEGTDIEAVGVLVLSDVDDDVLRAVIMFVNAPAEDDESVEGIVTEVVPEERRLVLGDDGVCVVASESATVIAVMDAGDRVEQEEITFDDIAEDDEVEIFDHEMAGDCYVADLLIVEMPDDE